MQLLSAFMPIIAACADLVLVLTPAIVLLTPAIVLWSAGLVIIPFSAHSECEAGRCWYPVLGVIAGLCLAVATVSAAPMSEQFRVGAILGSEGWWLVDSKALLTERLPFILSGMRHVVVAPLSSLPDVAFLAVLALLIDLTVLSGLIWAKGWPTWSLLAALPFTVGVAAIMLYALAVLLWLAAMVNFWLLGLLLLGYQRWRHHVRPLTHG